MKGTDDGSSNPPWWLRSHSKFNRLNSFQDFKIGRIAMFPLDSIMYEGMELTFNQENQALYVP
jgi:hypothetical protein